MKGLSAKKRKKDWAGELNFEIQIQEFKPCKQLLGLKLGRSKSDKIWKLFKNRQF
jgi:hypothetical protein